MSRMLAIAFAVAAVIVLAKCGKKKEEEAAAAPVAVGKIAITCGGFACVGTEAK